MRCTLFNSIGREFTTGRICDDFARTEPAQNRLTFAQDGDHHQQPTLNWIDPTIPKPVHRRRESDRSLSCDQTAS